MQDVESALDRARIAMDLERPAEARRILGKALIDAPQDYRLLDSLAAASSQLGDTAEAFDFARRAVAAAPDAFEPRLTLSTLHLGAGETVAAIEQARIAVDIDPDHPRALLTLAWILAKPGRSAEAGVEARALVEAALELVPDDPDTVNMSAHVMERLGDRSRTRELVDAGLALNPGSVSLLLLHAQLSMRTRQSRWRAAGVLRALLAERPGEEDARMMLAEVLWRAMLRLPELVWFVAGAAGLGSMWFGPTMLRVSCLLLLATIPLAWLRIVLRLRPQLPAGYARRRILRPVPVIALLTVAVASGLVHIGAFGLHLESARAMRAGHHLLVIAAIAAGLGHLFLMLSWSNRRVDEAERGASGRRMVAGLVKSGGLLLLVGVLAALRNWSTHPLGFWTVVAIFGVVAATSLLEFAVDTYRQAPNVARFFGIAVVFGLPLLLAVLVVQWSLGHLDRDALHRETTAPVDTVVPTTTAPVEPTTTHGAVPTTTRPNHPTGLFKPSMPGFPGYPTRTLPFDLPPGFFERPSFIPLTGFPNFPRPQ
ncbi:hypothetical protein D5S18_15015 [Nocardia panacis]|uniref:Uncharacterized protein n=1 Tax=Nocardia panacis TaxID=2340916 RepID=A0A3A4K3G7_9NOCA|nr:tetratricopeptide repeat protein [Nocardia panacis]RJO74763.1 hypothetical protein D5S18_15015 [Nocardia panacis]